MKSIPDLVLEDEQPTFDNRRMRGEKSKWFPLYKKIAEMQDHMWYKLTEIEDQKDARLVRVFLMNNGKRSKYLRENVYDKGYTLDIHGETIDGTTKLWVRKIKKM